MALDQPQGRLSLQGWVEKIRDRDMPVLAHTVEAVRSITEDETSSTGALSRVVLQDAGLTTKVLKLSNSVVFNPARQPISTVSRAIVVLGFDVLGKIVLTIYLIDAFLSGGMRGRVMAEMARCFHAAVQARALAVAKEVPQVEEVFIAALLGRVGEMAFWCFGGEAATNLDEILTEQPDERPEDLQLDILGFRLRSLTASLAREWRLGALVVGATESPMRGNAAEQAIALGYRIADAAEQGWDSIVARKAVEAYADMVGRPLSEVRDEILNNATEAARVAAQFGAADAARLIPLPASEEMEAIVNEEVAPEPDAMLQLRILRELAMMVAGQPSLNDVLHLVLEGIYRGLGMSRAVFALQSTDRKQVIGKAGLGSGADALVRRFAFTLDNTPGDVINELFAKAQAYWLRDPLPKNLRTVRLEHVTGQREGFIAPITTHGRAIGLFYADRHAIAPDEETWQGFLHFVQQASLCFEHVAARGQPRR